MGMLRPALGQLLSPKVGEQKDIQVGHPEFPQVGPLFIAAMVSFTASGAVLPSLHRQGNDTSCFVPGRKGWFCPHHLCLVTDRESSSTSSLPPAQPSPAHGAGAPRSCHRQRRLQGLMFLLCFNNLHSECLVLLSVWSRDTTALSLFPHVHGDGKHGPSSASALPVLTKTEQPIKLSLTPQASHPCSQSEAIPLLETRRGNKSCHHDSLGKGEKKISQRCQFMCRKVRT